MFATTIAVLLALGAAAADATRHNDRPFAGVNPNTLECDPRGLVELLLPHHTDCTRFYQCVHGREVSRNCARPLIFDFEIQNCEWRHETTCRVRGDWDESEESEESDENEGDGGGNGGDQGGDNGGSDKPMAGVDPNTLSCDPEGQIFLLLPHHSDCTRYYQCANGREVLMPACPRPLIFDFELQGCNWEWDATCILRTPEGEEKSEEKKSSEEEDNGGGQQSESKEGSDTEEDGDSNGDSEEKKSDEEIVEESYELVSKSKEDSDEDDSKSNESSGGSDGEGEGDEIGSGEESEGSGDPDIISEESSGESEEQEISEEHSGDGDESGEEGVEEEEEDIEGSGSGDVDDDLEWLAKPHPNYPLDILARLKGLVRAIRPVAQAQDASEADSQFSAILNCNRADSASRHVAHKTDCQRFWRCVVGVPQTFYCSDGLFFNEKSQQCDFETNVRCLAGQDDELDGEFILYK